MNKWEAKYKVLAAGITDKSYIDNAEKLVETAINLSATSRLSFSEVFCGMLHAVGLSEKDNCLVKTEVEMAEEAFLALGKIGCNLPQEKTVVGWICPVCGKGNAPFAEKCKNCEGLNA